MEKELLGLFEKFSFWQAVSVFGIWQITYVLKQMYFDSGKEYIKSWLQFRLDLMRGKLDKDLAEMILTGAFSRVENELICEVIKIFDINDRHSESRKNQIPSELRRAAARGLGQVIPRLLRYRVQQKSLAYPMLRIQQDEQAKLDFWQPVIQIICESHTQHDRTEAINMVNVQTERLLSIAIQELITNPQK